MILPAIASEIRHIVAPVSNIILSGWPPKTTSIIADVPLLVGKIGTLSAAAADAVGAGTVRPATVGAATTLGAATRGAAAADAAATAGAGGAATRGKGARSSTRDNSALLVT